MRSLFAQTTRHALTYEVIVVDDQSSDGTGALLGAMQREHVDLLRIITGPALGPAAARNAGVGGSAARWIAFTDDDQVAEPDWIHELISEARRSGAGCVVGRRMLAPYLGADLPASPRLRQLLGEDDWGSSPRTLQKGELPNTGNVLLERRLFDALGGLDEDTPFGGDDTDFFTRAESAGWSFRYAPRALMYHLTPASRTSDLYLRSKAERDGITKAWIQHVQHGGAAMLIAMIRWMLIALVRSARSVARGQSNEDSRYARFLRWHATGFAANALALTLPRRHVFSSYLSARTFRRVHLDGASR